MHRQFDSASSHGRHPLGYAKDGITETRQISRLAGGDFQFDLYTTVTGRSLRPATADRLAASQQEYDGSSQGCCDVKEVPAFHSRHPLGSIAASSIAVLWAAHVWSAVVVRFSGAIKNGGAGDPAPPRLSKQLANNSAGHGPAGLDAPLAGLGTLLAAGHVSTLQAGLGAGLTGVGTKAAHLR